MGCSGTLLPSAASITRFEQVFHASVSPVGRGRACTHWCPLVRGFPVAAKDEILTDAVRVEVIRVIDSDTVDVDFDLSRREDPDASRMIGIDIPETTPNVMAKKPARRPIACW